MTLGRSFGLPPAARGLVTSGPYRVVRHPIYLGYLMTHAGFLLSNFSWRNLGVLAVLYLAQAVRTLREEAVLHSGDQQADSAASALPCATASCHSCSETGARTKLPQLPRTSALLNWAVLQ